MQEMANIWMEIGGILALEAIFAQLMTMWMRWTAKNKLQGQAVLQAAVGVTGVVMIAGIRIGFEAAGFVLLCFALAGLPPAIEYFRRLAEQERQAQTVREESVDLDEKEIGDVSPLEHPVILGSGGEK